MTKKISDEGQEARDKCNGRRRKKRQEIEEQRREIRIRCQRFRDRGQDTKGGSYEDSNDEMRDQMKRKERGD
jgi:hypothetical protein